MTATRRLLLLAWLAVPVSLLAAGLLCGPWMILRSTLWMVAEIAGALTVAFLFGFLAALVANARTLPGLDQVASRGLELIAALPMVLGCAVLVVLARVPVPVAVAMVVGLLGGLRCVRVVAYQDPRHSAPSARLPRRAILASTLGVAFPPVTFTVIEELVALEAAIAWLGYFDAGWLGGWGERLGDAARCGNVLQLLGFCVVTAAACFAVKATVTWRAMHPRARPTVRVAT